MKTLVRMAAILLAGGCLAIPGTALAASPNDQTVVNSATSYQLNAVFETLDNGCVLNDLIIHGDVEYKVVSVVLESYDLCNNVLLFQGAGGNWGNAEIQIDPALQIGHVADTVQIAGRKGADGGGGGSTGIAVTFDLTWTGNGPMIAGPFAPGLAGDTIGFHLTLPDANVTFTGVGTKRAAAVSGSTDVPGFTFPLTSIVPDLTVMSHSRGEFIVALKPI